MIHYTCPDSDRWTALLGEDMPAEEQLELQSHLNDCPECQRTLETCVADRTDWDRLPHWLTAPPEDPSLQAVVAQLKVSPEATPGATDMPLDFLDPADRPALLGRLGQYEVIEEIGRGGMGVVLKALDPKLHRVVAIKVLAPQLAVSGSARKRFTREARAAAAVAHDHVVTIHAVDEFKSLPYLVMQFVPGSSLQQKISADGPLPTADILRIGAQAAAGLAAAHAQGLIHRDVKPANILLENGVERVRLSDFGLARAIDDASVTQSGVITGTPQYMSPEQACGQPLDHRADLFSLGSVLYAMATGHAPFRGAHGIEVLRRVSDDTPRPIREVNPEIPAWLTAIINRLMAKKPDERFQSAAEVSALLERCLAHVQNPTTVPLTAIPGYRAPARRRRLWTAVALGGLACAIAAVVLQFKTPEGTLVVEIDDPSVKVTLDGKDLVINGAGVQEIRLKPGAYAVQASKDGKTKNEIVSISQGGKTSVRVSLLDDGPHVAAANASPDRSKGPIVGEKKAAPVPRNYTMQPAHAPYAPDLPRFNFTIRDQPWSTVLFEFSKVVNAPVEAAVKPAGTFSFTAPRDERGQTRQYGLGELIDILNESLIPQKFLLVRRSKDFIVVQLDKPIDPALYANVPTYELKQRGATELVNIATFSDKVSTAETLAMATAVLSPLGKAEVTVHGAISMSDQAENVRRFNEQLGALDRQRTAAESKNGEGARPAGPPRPAPGKPSIPSDIPLKGAQPAGLPTQFDKPVREFSVGERNTSVNLLLLSHGSRLITAHADGKARIWDLKSAKSILTFEGQGRGAGALALSNDGARVAMVSDDRIIRVCNTTTGKLEVTMAAREMHITGLAFSLDGTRLYSGARGGTALNHQFGELCTWDVESGDLVNYHSTFAIHSLAKSPNGRSLYVAHKNKFAEIMLRETVPFRNLRECSLQGSTRELAASPNGAHVAVSYGDDCAVRLFDVKGDVFERGEVGTEISADTRPVVALAFSPDGTRLLTGSIGGTVKCWSVTDPTHPRCEFSMHVPFSSGAVDACVFSWDGDQVITAHRDGIVRFWDVPNAKTIP